MSFGEGIENGRQQVGQDGYVGGNGIEGESKVDREFEAEFGRDGVDGCWNGGTGKAVKW